ncbi:NUDIX hydrolase [Shouchella lehensis]|uniref:NUDIX hydrolase n=1 Tax=Shouchella lehensis G1 TaxID=1246626 RepID=A0A060LU37_9BACI|nr:NUDIX hydrolase [Shouchella lehensis]AIC93510.1 NUDIX hydrolase [Shouchella lehensis G1]
MDYVQSLRQKVGTQPLILPGSVVLIVNNQGELLLENRNDGGWGLPGGLMELGESLEQTAIREVKEETGLDVKDLQLLGVFSGEAYHFTFDNGDELYSVTAVYWTNHFSGTLKVNSNESKEVRFVKNLPSTLKDEYKDYILPYYQSILTTIRSSEST